jgi:hypothetical protein
MGPLPRGVCRLNSMVSPSLLWQPCNASTKEGPGIPPSVHDSVGFADAGVEFTNGKRPGMGAPTETDAPVITVKGFLFYAPCMGGES